MIQKLLIFLILICFSIPCEANILKYHSIVAKKNTSSGVDYSDIIFYHDCDDLDDANKSGGSATVTYDAGILDESGSPILGSGSWDNNNDGFDDLNFAISGNVDFASGRIGFYFKPNELASGRICWTNGSDFTVSFLSTNDVRVVYLGTTQDYTSTNLSTGITYFLEFEFNGASCEFFKDGSSLGSFSGTGSVNDSTFHFFSSDGNAWDSFVDQVISSNDPNRDLNAVKTVTDFS